MTVPGVTTRVTSRAHQPFGLRGIFDLIADGDAMSGLQQLLQMRLQGDGAETRPSE